MTDKVRKYLADILHAIELVENFQKEITTFDDYQKDLKSKSAIERQLGIIGEAVNKLDKEVDDLSLSSSRQIINFRNRLIHAYDNIDDAIVWTIVKNHLPKLKSEVENLKD